MKERGSGHYKFINKIMFLLYSNTLTDAQKSRTIETTITQPFIINYLVDVLLHYTKLTQDGSINFKDYINNVYCNIVDIWGYITIYVSYLEMLSNNYVYLNDYELKIFNQIKLLFNTYLYSPRHKPINIKKLMNNLTILEKYLYEASTNKM